MSSNPYENEPGYENARSAEDKKNIKNYVAKVVLIGIHHGHKMLISD